MSPQLPLRGTPSLPHSERRSRNSGDDDSPLVAIVDDEASVRRAIVRLLRAAHYRTAEFNSGCALLASLAERFPACAVVDLQMPTMTGLELQEELRQLDEPLPLVIITAHDEPGMRARCMALGAKQYFRKPVDGKALLDSIRQVVSDSRPASTRPT
ncbi:MAG TPA: response regulator [Gammaproteobacteria bacterium]|nr:response regulator [Gammaproteobacteria bacterium]